MGAMGESDRLSGSTTSSPPTMGDGSGVGARESAVVGATNGSNARGKMGEESLSSSLIGLSR